MAQLNCIKEYLGQILATIEKIVNLTFSCLYTRPIKVVGQLKFWKLLSNSAVTFNVENVNLLSNPNVKPENGVAYIKKMCLEMEH